MRRRRGDAHPTPAPERAPVVATATFRSSTVHHGLAAYIVARIVRADGSYILARGATVSDALRRAACAVEREQAVGPLGADPRRLALGALRKAASALWNEDPYTRTSNEARADVKTALDALEEELRFDVDHDLEHVRFHREEVTRG
jgi:hypothetical protein